MNEVLFYSVACSGSERNQRNSLICGKIRDFFFLFFFFCTWLVVLSKGLSYGNNLSENEAQGRKQILTTLTDGFSKSYP